MITGFEFAIGTRACNPLKQQQKTLHMHLIQYVSVCTLSHQIVITRVFARCVEKCT